MAPLRCLLCGAPRAQCGHRSASHSRPVDALEEAPTMPATGRYSVRLPDGRTVVLKLSTADLSRYGEATPLDDAQPDAAPPAKARRTVRNKARRSDADKAR